MIIEKYPYEKLSRATVNGTRLYECANGQRLPSVTSVLSATKSKESKEALNNWRKRVGHQKAAEITSQAAGRGTRMHTFLENYIHTGAIGEYGTNPYAKESWKMAETVVAKSLHHVTEFYGSEVSLYFPQIYAGATDCVAEYNGELAIIDFKQTNKPKKIEWIDDYFIQLVAYANAHNTLYGTDIKRGIIMMCSPDLTYQQFEINSENFDEWNNKWWDKLAQYYEGK